MNRKEAEKIQPGALVRWSYGNPTGINHGVVLTKRYELETKRERALGLKKPDRYILTIHWLKHGNQRASPNINVIDEASSWDLMVVSHAA
jgi:hypothetical protein